MGKPENRIEKKLCDGVKALGGKAYKFVSPGCNGVPDRIICLPNGTVIFAETKAPKGEPTKQQQHRINEMRRMGQKVFIPSTIEQVDRLLAEIKEGLSDGVHTP